MTTWVLLAAAIVAEVTATLSLKAALEHPGLYVVVVLGYVASFVCLAAVLRRGMPLGVAYGMWGALGVAATAVMSAQLFGEAITPAHGGGAGPGGGRCPPGRSGIPVCADARPERTRLMAPLLLTAAILFEVMGTLSLRLAVVGRRGWYAVVVSGYLLAFACLSAALSHGMGLGFAYGVWTAIGIALTAIASKILFDEPLTPVMAGGIALIACGVLLLELGQVH